MIEMEQKVREKLEAEAAKWVEEELQKRMFIARKAIKEQVSISESTCGQLKAQKHLKDATALAQESIRNELEFEAAGRVEEQLKDRARPLLEDHNLESNLC